MSIYLISDRVQVTFVFQGHQSEFPLKEAGDVVLKLWADTADKASLVFTNVAVCRSTIYKIFDPSDFSMGKRIIEGPGNCCEVYSVKREMQAKRFYPGAHTILDLWFVLAYQQGVAQEINERLVQELKTYLG